MRHGLHLLMVAGLLVLFGVAHAMHTHGVWQADGTPDLPQTVQQAEAVIEHIQWGGGNSCACPAVNCSFMNASSPPCQVSCGARQSAVCQCATCQGAGGIVRMSGFISFYCVTPPSSGSREERRLYRER
jgi:hypothetical protein